MRMLLFIFFVSAVSEVTAQVDTFTDSRDGQRYETIIIGNKRWFREHLRYQTRYSYCPGSNKDPMACLNGNYYSNLELDTICPKGWRVPTLEDWNSYIDVLYALTKVEIDSAKSNSLPPPRNDATVTFRNFNILDDSLLQLKPIGWVEGKKQQLERSLTLWVKDQKNHDLKFHVHLAKLGFVKHTHEHNIIDKPKKIRKFAVRCVCELSAR